MELNNTEEGNNQSNAPPHKIEVPQYTGEMPDEDVDEDRDVAPPEPAAPPLDQMDTIPGYHNIGFSGDVLPPPPVVSESDVVLEDRKNKTEVAVLSEDEARQALRSYVDEHCCFGKSVVDDLTFTELQSSNAFYYKLDTFTEARKTEWDFKPYKGGPLDGPENGPAPGPWEIPSQCKELFKDEKKDLEVPHTASTKPCHNCFAQGFVRCWSCEGRGRKKCLSCHGSGEGAEEGKCFSCDGNGYKNCITCDGKGMTVCKVCEGYRNLKYYIKLTIKWHKHDDNHIVERTSLPDKLIKKAEGQVAFEETYPMVYPIQHFPEQEINQASANLLTKHQYSMERILMQKHKVKVVPVTVCRYKWKDQDSDFIVYGFDKNVHAPDYPQQTCWGCNLL